MVITPTRKTTRAKATTVAGNINIVEAFLESKFADSKIPDFKKQNNVPYIPFGTGNDYPDYLETLYKKSSKHAAIINNKCVYIIGKGFDETDPVVKAFLAKANPKKSWLSIIKLICKDIEKTGGFILEIIPKRGGGYNVHHVRSKRMRTNEDNTEFWYKKDWEKSRFTTNVQTYPAFTPGIKVKSFYYYKEDESETYALPGWVAACNWIEADIEVSKCTLTNAKTGFSASKFINFFNGDPPDEKKKSITKRLTNAATGSEGTKLIIGFNNDPAKAPTVGDLGQSDLTKEDFSVVDDLITNNIYAGHQVTHPLLFGIQQAGKLGNSSELKIAFEIFKNTYANAKQQNLENIVKRFATLNGVVGEFKLLNIDPIGIDLTDPTLLEIAPRSWLLEQYGIDPVKYPDAPAVNKEKAIPGGPSNTVPLEHSANSILTNLSGKQHQHLARIVRKYGQGKLTEAQALLELKNGFGFTEEDAKTYLGIEEAFSSDESYTEEAVAEMFEKIGDARDLYGLVKSDSYSGEDDTVSFAFAAATELSYVQKNVLAAIKKTPKITNQEIADTLKIPLEQVNTAVDDLVKNKVLDTAGADGVRKILTKLPEAVKLPAVLIRYSYEKRAIATGADVLPTTRPFCKKLVELNRYYTREQIQQISERLGYSVFKRAGGFWLRPDGTVDPQCRHEWKQNVVIKKN